jgi:Glycosyl transferase family 2.
MKISCIVTVGPKHHVWLEQALASCVGLFSETILVADEAVQFQPIVQRDRHRFRLVISTDQSIAYAKNLGIAVATGDFIICFDADDVVDRPGMQDMIGLVKNCQNQYDIYHGQVREFVGPNQYDGLIWPMEPGLVNLHNIDCIPASSIFRTSMWWKLGGFRHQQYEDWNFWIRARDDGYRFKYHPVITYHHRNWSGSATASHEIHF